MNALKSILLASGLALCALASACSAPLPPTQSTLGPPLPNPGPDKEYQVKFPDPGHGMARYILVTLGDDSARDCGLVRTHFELDSSEPVAQEQLAIRSLAACLDRPGLRDAQLSLVGRADTRGSAAYNVRLALRRAERVKSLLVLAGMATDRIRVSSSGERDAVGDDKQYSYGYDRRVDAIIDVVHTPR
jgi:OmpA-OmpF porin, OOP family